MSERLIDAEALKKAITYNREISANATCDVLDIIDNAPTVKVDNYAMGYQDGIKKALSEQEIKKIDRPFSEGTSDGYIYIFCEKDNGVVLAAKKVLIPEKRNYISLLEIKKKYPDVKIVIFEDYFEGKVYRYGNHGKFWELVGSTRGFA